MSENILLKNWLNVLPEGERRGFINRSKSINPEDSVCLFKLLYDIKAISVMTGEEPIKVEVLALVAACNSQEDNIIGMPGDTDIEDGCNGIVKKFKQKAKLLANSEANTEIVSNEFMSKQKSTRINLYGNVIRNETYRMMESIDMIMSEAMCLFGPERTQIFIDLLADELFHFGSAGAVSEFVPNLAESAIRQNVISFFEYSSDVMNQLMTSLLRCPDNERLQQLPEQKFISLMQSVIKSSLDAKTYRRKRLSLEQNRLIILDSQEFVRALGEEIPEDVLNISRQENRLESPQPSERRQNGVIHFFPSDCRLFIYIPTEKGSYWHKLDMQRASRIKKT